MAIKEIHIGDRASFTKTIAECDVYGFAGISGDFNPVHIDEDKAVKGLFKHRIAHGMLVGSLISTVLGGKLPGEGTIYLEQNLEFRSPVYIGDTCTAHVEVIEVLNLQKGIYKLKTWVVNQKEEYGVTGHAIVKYIQ